MNIRNLCKRLVVILFQLFSRNPAFDGDLIEGYKPVKPNEINFLEVSDNGLSLGKWPNHQSFWFVQNIIRDTYRLMAENENVHPKSEYEKTCHINGWI